MNLGAEPKKIAILGGLLAVAAIVLYTQVFSGPSEPAPARRSVAPLNAPASAAVPSARAAATRRRGISSSLGEFKPIVGSPNPQDRPDPATIDPEIHFDRLAKLQTIAVESTGRNIFQMGSAPAPAAAQGPLKPVPTKLQTIAVNHPPAPGAAGPQTPQAPPITFRYYGFEVLKADGRKQAFLLDGEDIMIAGENDVLKRGRYKVTHIGVNSITIEDTQFKHSQTLQLEEVTG
ncbi:MAG TPA: hypothetical protein VG345_16205 [Bryobacteraceae bacterium]|nr:hypothetical protein [Bryobacteraceae bacterium]